MLINYIGGGSTGQFHLESNELTLDALSEVMRQKELNFSVSDETIINYSYKNDSGRNTGEFTSSTLISLPPTGVVTITQMARETKARYDNEEVQDIIIEAKEALVSQEYKALRSACRELSNISKEVKELVGNYSHYTVSSLVEAVDRAVKFLSPEVAKVGTEDIQAIFARIEAIERQLKSAPTNDNSELQAVLEDLAFVANHFGIMLPNHTELFEN